MGIPPGPEGGLDLRSYPVLVVDDEPDNLHAFRYTFRRSFEVLTAGSGPEALDVLSRRDVAVIVADQRMPGMNGLEFLREAMGIRPEAVGILLTAYTDVEVLIDALNSGHVYRYVAKPWDAKELKVVLAQAIERFALRRENRRLMERLAEVNRYLEGEVRDRVAPAGLVGTSPALREVLETIARVAPTSSTVLVRGESGTGKELVARAIHEASARRNGPFIRVACGALSPGVLESELFGHEKGAFTGAYQRKLGRFELADGGTIFLDEIGDVPLDTQVKLLRVIQEREFERVGGTETLRVDVRVVSATNRNLEDLVARGLFREDLYYRLNVFPILVPPLRERREDIPLLAEFFLERFRGSRPFPVGFTPEAMARLVDYSWPGNVRELMNVVERAVILARGEWIGTESIGPGFGSAVPLGPRWEPSLPAPTGSRVPARFSAVSGEGGASPRSGGGLFRRLEELERAEVLRALELGGGSKAEAARLLGMSRTTLYYRMKKLGITDG